MVWSMSTKLSVEGEVTLANTHRQIRLFFFHSKHNQRQHTIYTHSHSCDDAKERFSAYWKRACIPFNHTIVDSNKRFIVSVGCALYL